MKLSRDDSWALSFWQRLQFQADSPDSSPAQRADASRRSMFQLQMLKNSGKISSELYFRLCREVAINYQQVVDNQDSNKGLNNFAEAVLTLANGRRNESQIWKTSLSMESIQKLPVYKNIMARAELGGTFSESAEVSSSCSSELPWLTSNNSGTLNTSSVLYQDSKESKPNTLAVSTNSSDRVQLNEEKKPWTRIGLSALDTYQTPSNNGTYQENEQGQIGNSYCKQAFSEGSEYKMENLRTMDCSSGVSYNGPGIMTSTTLKRKAPSHNSGTENSTSQLYQSTKSNEDDQMFSLQSSAGPRFLSNYSEDSSRQRNSFLFHKPPREQRVHHSNDAVDDFGGNRMRSKSSDKQTCSDDEEQESNPSDFMTARQKLVIDTNKKNQSQRGEASYSRQGVVNNSNYGATRRTLGTRRGPSRQFIPPVLNRNSDDEGAERSTSGYYSNSKRNPSDRKLHSDEQEVNDKLKNIEPKMVELITSEIMDHGPPLSWDDIAGLEFAKTVIKEIVVWPMLRPDIFKGLRGPPKGILLFGPPGTGKTLIGKCIASQSKATFFSISASSLTSKWVGEGEKMVRALFAVARCHLPAVIFIDEIDSLLSQRTDGEHDASRRIKTEFLVQLDGATTNSDERLLVVGATNRPQEIDEAARRRLVKRLYIPLPEAGARKQIMYNLLSQQKCSITDQELSQIVNQTDGYSGSDMANLCREAALGPIRSITDIQCIEADQVRPITIDDFRSALHQVRASVSEKDLDLYIQWNKLYGSGVK